MTELDIKRRASELLQKGRYDEAVAEYEALLEGSKKHNPAIHNLIGDIYVKQGNFEKGFQHYLSAAKAYKEEGLFHNGIAVGKKILRLDRDQTDVYGMLADLYARQGLGMDSLKFLREFARRKEEADEYPAALAAYAEACQVLADVPDVHMAYGEMLERVDRLDDAASCYTNAAQAYADKGWNDQAEQLTRRAKGVQAGGGGAPEASSTSVSDLMSLRSLDDPPPKPAKSAKPAPRATPQPGPAPAPSAPSEGPAFMGRSDEPLDLDLNSAAASSQSAHPPLGAPDTEGSQPWSEYKAEEAALPPPPPLPPRGAAAPDTADPNNLFIEPPGLDADEPALTLDTVETGSLQEALDEMAGLDAPAPPAPAAPEPEGLVLDVPAASAPPPPPLPPAAPPAPAAAAPTEAESLDLADLPGIILPGQAPPAPAAPEPPPVAETPVAEPPAAPPPVAEPVAAELPPAPAADPASSGVHSNEDLHEFFEATAAESSEHTVVIGDDFELLREGGDVNEVIADFRDATMEILDLEDHQAHYDLGTTYMEMELFDEAAAEFELSARGGEHALASQEMLGYCFLRKGQIDIAIRELHKGLEIPGHDERSKLGLLYNLGIACGVLDQEQDAIGHFQKILQIDPEFRDTRSRLERLVQSSA